MAGRRLTDLYIVGRTETFDDGGGEPIEVFVRKLSPIDHKTALQRANAARSRVASIKNNPDSDEYQANWAAVLDYDVQSLIDYLVDEERMQRAPIVEAELAAEEEWETDSYLSGLRETWLDELKDVYAANPEDPEALRVLNELKRFDDAVTKEVDAHLADFRSALQDRTEDDLRHKVFEKFLAMQGSIAWLNEYRHCEVWLSTRLPDRKAKYFDCREEVDELPPQIYNRLAEIYKEISVDPLEGKDSRGTDTSSQSSEPPESQEVDPTSGPADVTA